MLSSQYWAVYHREWTSHLEHCRKQLAQARLRRARGYYLYFDRLASVHTAPRKKGQISRLCDLYLDAGQALNGYRPAGVGNRLKNTMARSLYAALPSSKAGRLNRLLKRLFPAIKGFGLYHSLDILGVNNQTMSPLQFSMPELLRCRKSGNLSLWRPLSQEGQKRQTSYSLMIPALSSLPLPYLVLHFTGPDLPSSDVCSPLQLETLILALGQTESLLQQSQERIRLVELGSKLIGFLACSNSPETQPSLLQRAWQGRWQLDGIYLYWQTTQTSYTAYSRLWQAGLEKGFLLPPNPWAPLLIPPILFDNQYDGLQLNSEGKRLRQLLQKTTYS